MSNIRPASQGATLDTKGPMLNFLFPRLTPAQRRGQPLFDGAVGEARARHWYVEAGVPDTLDGRFAMLATVCAMVSIRLEALAERGAEQSAALTERFVEAMDAEHRQMGVSDPALGRTVRRLVSALGNRADIWREAVAGTADWRDAAARSVYRGTPPSDNALDHTAAGLDSLWQSLRAMSDETLIEGRIG